MRFLRNPEVKGILVLILIILAVAAILAGVTGKLEQWFGINWFSGPAALDKIVFVSSRSGGNELYIMNTDGSDQKPLTIDARVLSAPAISASGRRIAFVGISGGASQLLSVGANGGTPDVLAGSTMSKRLPSFSPDGRKIAYIAGGRVYVADSDGGNASAVLPTEREVQAAMANPLTRGETPTYQNYAWGPDSEKMAAVTKDPDGSDVLVYLPKPDGEEVRFARPTQARVRIAGIAWAADRPVLAASMVSGGNSWLLVVDLEQEKVVPTPAFQRQELGKPALSPDGSEVVVPSESSSARVPSGSYRLNLESRALENMAQGDFENPAYSPRGDQILTVKIDRKGGARNIVVLGPGATDARVLTHDGRSFDAVWSPASKK